MVYIASLCNGVLSVCHVEVMLWCNNGFLLAVEMNFPFEHKRRRMSNLI